MRRVQKYKLTKTQASWIGLFVYIIASDAYLIRTKNDTLSICFGGWLQNPKSRKVCIAITGLVVSHLYWATPLPGQKLLRRVATKQLQLTKEEIEI